MAQELKDKYLTQFIEEDDACLADVGILFKDAKEAHWWAQEVVLHTVAEETGKRFWSIDELLEAA